MKHSVYSMTLDVTQRHKQVFLPVMLGDTARSLMMTLVSGGAPFLLDVGTLAVFSGQKADGTTLYNHCIIEDGVRVRYDFTEHTASAEGVVECQLLIYGADGTLLASPRFCLVVDARVVYGDVTVSENEKNAIDAMMLSEASRVLAEEKRASAEVARSSAESARETAESERLAAESVRLATEQARLDAERIRDASESVRIEKEALRLRAEEDRAAAEAERLTAETARAGAETVRLASETERLDGEKSRVSSETARLLAEELRQESETARIQAENLRLSEERARESAEKTRASAEVGRGNAETARVRAESARTSAETERMTSETARKDAEALRAEAESVREQGYRSFDGRIAENAARVSANHKRITNLERRLSDEMFLSDSEITYQRSVPEDALPFAAVAEIGGMSYKSRNLFDENRFVELSNGVKNSDGSYTVSSAKMGRASLSLIGKANMQYTVSLTVTNQTTNKATYVIFKYSDGTEDAYGNRYFNAVGNYTFVSETNKTAVRVSFIHNDENTFTIKDFMLNEGETALPYEPYFEGLRDAKVTAVESEGRSLFPASAVYGSWATEVVKDGRNCYRFITNANRQFAPIAFKENTQYTVRFDVCAAKMQTDAEPTDRPLVIFYTDGT
ncbi:MAG: hypothetical protein IJV98_02045, partial [Clostridia bacterium]|nr:hypothetical protein [Clostridia bacterium]